MDGPVTPGNAGPPDAPARDREGRGRTDRPLAIFLRFLKFGLLAWGGPVAQIQMISKECVEEEGWVSNETFRKTLAVYQVLPGPEAHELCVYFGLIRGGRIGGLMAGLGFMLPGFLLMLGLSALYVSFGLSDQFASFFFGLQAAVGALVAVAIIRMARNFIDDVPLAVIAVASFLFSFLVGLHFVLVLVVSGLAYEAWRWRGLLFGGAGAVSPLPIALLVGVATASTGLALAWEVFFEGLKAGLLTFGGAYTVIPFLQEAAVDSRGWVTEEQFLDGIAIGGILPAPLIIFATFIGYLTDGLTGALLMTVGIFLPAFILPIFFHRQLVAFSENERFRPLLLGVAAGVIGLIAAVAVTIIEFSVTDLASAAIAVVAFIVLLRFPARLTIPAVVLGAGLAGAAFQLATG